MCLKINWKVINGFLITMCLLNSSYAQVSNKFAPMDEYWPTPNAFRSANGAPGPNYWQQKADYKIQVKLDETAKKIIGEETITYFNNSPDTLNYLWLQLDQNVRAEGNLNDQTTHFSLIDGTNSRELVRGTGLYDYEGGINISTVTNPNGISLKYVINRTMMRIDLDVPLAPDQNFTFNLSWSYNIYDRLMVDGRGGSEYFPDDDNYIYTIAQFYPRMCVYDDVEGWQNKQFILQGEFALSFGDFEVDITVPDDHIVAATGVLINENDVLNEKQKERLARAKNETNKPVIINTESEAIQNEKEKSSAYKTWRFRAEQVRDFAFASSRKFIWDAQLVKLDGNDVLAMSYYPKESNPLWENESTKAIKNTLEVYSDLLFTYPYPVCISISSAENGMEYPMISFNEGRPNKKGKYGDTERNELVDVVIHEVGHNYFPMIINSDEKLYAWMDEGINTYFELQTKRSRYPKDPTWGTPNEMTFYMAVDEFIERPVMTNPENQIFSAVGSYGQPGAALEVLKNLVLEPELFNAAFKEYANRWKFKHPKPADFFRTMEDASGVDLSWFWRGWFYGNEAVDISIERVKWYRLDAPVTSISDNTKHKMPIQPERWNVTTSTEREYKEFPNRLDDAKILESIESKNAYEVTFKNVGGLISPIVLEFTFQNNKKESMIIPAEIWRLNEKEVTKVFFFDDELKKITIDPNHLSGDVTKSNNVYPR